MERATADFQQLAEGLQAARQNSTGSSGMLGGGYSKVVQQGPQTITLSTIMGRIQASIDHADVMIKGAAATAVLLCGEKTVLNPSNGGEVSSDLGDGCLSAADRLLNVLGARLGELQGLQETIARRLS